MWQPLGVASEVASWQPEPKERGSWSILSSCLTTIGLCVWTALHLNIPEHGRKPAVPWRKILWAILGLFAPEFASLNTLNFLWIVLANLSGMEKHLADLSPPLVKKRRWWKRLWSFPKSKGASGDDVDDGSGSPGEKEPSLTAPDRSPDCPSEEQDDDHRRKHRWTSTHSFYAIMGGFVIDNGGNQSVCPLPQGRQRLTLLPRALLFLAEHEPDLIPDIPESSIRDKSKSEGVAKLIAYWQAVWYVAQFASRLGEGWNVTMLELNTLLHVVYALLVYFVFWIHKPLDVTEPTVIVVDGERQAQVFAALSLVSECGKAPLQPWWVDWAENDDVGRSTDDRVLSALALFKAHGLHSGEVDLDELEEPALQAAMARSSQSEEEPPESFHDRTAKAIIAAITTGSPPPDLDVAEIPQKNKVQYRRLKGMLDPAPIPQMLATIWSRLGVDFERVWTYGGLSELWSDTAGRSDGLQSGIGDADVQLEETAVIIPREDIHRFHLGLRGMEKYPSLASRVSSLSNMLAPKAPDLSTELLVQMSTSMREVEPFSSTPIFSTIHFTHGESATTNQDNAPSASSAPAYMTPSQAARILLASPWISLCGFFITSSLYGGVHLILGWNGPMHTHAEVMLWRLASIMITVPWSYMVIGLPYFAVILTTCLLIVVAVGLMYAPTFAVCWTMTQIKGTERRALLSPGIRHFVVTICAAACSIFFAFPFVMVVTVVAAYLLARVYIVVECFLSLPYAPESAFHLPNWSSYTFHL
ncbi:hypothetical protein CkaCkLH20_06569 [Colletotrichum karsti]|uniref:Uncharacterized protein n=1 Tax=Colletotrichum karsti TaxID=1095194 RepID=A0A9P6I4B4_9PEZI|nr:uncharacterized protein CkaCkLH20_06569 [Colletotrichum karsti]KAF9876123.1 hypothetical protein CkaCkLH20_06569 [Colletotrichum karsti]